LRGRRVVGRDPSERLHPTAGGLASRDLAAQGFSPAPGKG
jgi:hypothetical protein